MCDAEIEIVGRALLGMFSECSRDDSIDGLSTLSQLYRYPETRFSSVAVRCMASCCAVFNKTNPPPPRLPPPPSRFPISRWLLCINDANDLDGWPMTGRDDAGEGDRDL